LNIDSYNKKTTSTPPQLINQYIQFFQPYIVKKKIADKNMFIKLRTIIKNKYVILQINNTLVDSQQNLTSL